MKMNDGSSRSDDTTAYKTVEGYEFGTRSPVSVSESLPLLSVSTFICLSGFISSWLLFISLRPQLERLVAPGCAVVIDSSSSVDK